jgi:hypothetical protein
MTEAAYEALEERVRDLARLIDAIQDRLAEVADWTRAPENSTSTLCNGGGDAGPGGRAKARVEGYVAARGLPEYEAWRERQGPEESGEHRAGFAAGLRGRALDLDAGDEWARGWTDGAREKVRLAELAEADRIVAAAEKAREPEIAGLRNIAETIAQAGEKFAALRARHDEPVVEAVLAGAGIKVEAGSLRSQPMTDVDAAASKCEHRGCRRRAYGRVANEAGTDWLACADHYEQDLAAQAIRVGHEPAWRVPIGPEVVLERRRGGPIGVVVDGQLRNYISAGELAKVFEGPVE